MSKKIEHEDFPIKVPVEVAVAFDVNKAIKQSAEVLVDALLRSLQDKLLKRESPWRTVEKLVPGIAEWRLEHPDTILIYDELSQAIRVKD